MAPALEKPGENCWCLLLLGRSLFRSFERVDFRLNALNIDFAVGSEVAQAANPFLLGSRSNGADIADGTLNDAFATLTLFYDGLAACTFKDTALFRPKGTLGTGKNSLTLHG